MEHTHPITTQILNLLENNNMWFETFEHEPVRTSEEAAKVRRGYTMNQGAKALLAEIKINKNEGKTIMIILPGDLKFDKSVVKNIYKAKDIKLVSEDKVREITGGVEPGGVPPFGNLFNLEVIADRKLFENEKIIFNAGSKSFSIAIMSEDYKKLVNPTITDISTN